MYVHKIYTKDKKLKMKLRATQRFSTDHECEIEQCISVSNHRKIYIFKTYIIY